MGPKLRYPAAATCQITWVKRVCSCCDALRYPKFPIDVGVSREGLPFAVAFDGLEVDIMPAALQALCASMPALQRSLEEPSA
jgi:hypothetical protein